MNSDYSAFLDTKRIVAEPVGFEPGPINPMFFDFQSDITRWGIRRGRAALLEGCGLGKGPQQLEWSRQVVEHSGKPVIGFAPLAVSQQFVSEAAKFGYDVNICATQDDVRPGTINITNYQKLSHFNNPSQFGGIFIDESSCLKGFDGKFRRAITDFASEIPYRVAASATPAPNDYMELGNHAEFLGIMTLNEMLATFFTHDGGDTSKWRLKGHAEDKFWEWLATWAVCIQRPSDLGYDDGKYSLPPLHMHQHVVPSEAPEGYLFPMEGQTLQERHGARRDSIEARVKLCADLVNASDQQWLIWCNLNDESRMLAKLIRDSVEVTGSDKDAHKERSAIDFVGGRIGRIVTKPSIYGFGMNMQNCWNEAFVGLSDSYEQIHQAIRRCWRFGQTRDVHCHVITSEAEGAVLRNIERKERQAKEMFESMARHMATISTKLIRGATRERDAYAAVKPIEIPSWLRSETL